MPIKIILIGFIFLSNISVAFDTEIYGTAEIDEGNQVNSNVLFIMDTSGSMSGEVAITQNSFTNSQTYIGSYISADIYNSLNDDSQDGHDAAAFTDTESYECSDVISELNANGRVLGEFYQKRNGWKNLQDGSNNPIRCDSGRSYWLYTGNYLNWYHDSSNVTTSTRMEVVVDVVKDLTLSLSNINLGLMRFDQISNGGMVDVAVADIATSGAQIRTKLDEYYPQGGTPLEETLYEASLYYRGETMQYGNFSFPNSSVTSARESSGSSQYKSPVSATCQKNHIILLTDGEPTSDSGANSKIRTLISGASLPAGLSESCSGNGDCMDELAYWLNNSDQSDDFVGDQSVTTYTIGGFELEDGVELLKNTASWGGGVYYEANDTGELATALESIFLDILATDSTFTAPAVSVNAFNATQHSDELFYALFRPSDNIQWGGNLKKYRLTDEGYVVDANEALAISESTGFFNDGAFDYWNDTEDADGDNVTQGGFASLLEAGDRRIYTDASATLMSSFTLGSNKPSFLMDSYTDEEFLKVQRWSMGFDVDDVDGDGDDTDSLYAIGDPLHSAPLIITYGGSDSNPDSTIFFGTNEGFIHGLDANTGKEELAFIPTALHGNLIEYYNNTTAAGEKPFGMDGAITNWMYDVNNNNVILNSAGDVENGEHVYLYAGMRRGGKNYYALDVTDRDSPQMLFTIEGGVGDFSKLGETWARATVAKVKYNGESRFVLLFTGGYDNNQDGNDVAEADSIGNAIYMVDATTGERLWWASNSDANLNIPEMVNSMPASISAVDISGDGHIDYFFAADMGGRVFRFDINASNTGDDFAQGGMIASLSGTDENSNRRFYNKPNVALVKDKQYGDYLTIAIGSGHRAHPIYTTVVENRFYVMKDFYPYAKPSTYTTLMEADETKVSLGEDESANPALLYNATGLMNGGELTSDMQMIMNNGGGWYITFDTEGEKVLAQATTVAGAILFTSFSPSGSTVSECGADTGMSRLYALDQKWATAVIDLDGDGDTDSDDASMTLAHSGIAPAPVIIYRDAGAQTIAVGTEAINDSRFEPLAECIEGDSCTVEPKDCDVSNCYVTPVYWRENLEI